MAQQAEKVLQPWTRLDRKVVMVTGASSGLGREFCLDLAKAGCKIIAAARRTDLLKTLCEEINKAGLSTESSTYTTNVQAVAVELDLQSKGSVIDACVQKAWDSFGRIDALVNNAGYRGNVSSPLDITEEEWDNVITTNITGQWLVTKCVGRRIRDANQKGSVINISSVAGAGRVHSPGGVAYSTSKIGLNNMTQAMAMELGVHNIRVNAICPGIFKSEITELLMKKKWFNKVNERTVPLKTYGTTDPALTSLVRFLIHDSSEYLTGNIFIVDAGMSLPGLPLFSSL